MQELRYINPEGVFDPSEIYTHMVIPPPGRIVFLAGQWGGDVEGVLAGDEFGAQVDQAFANVRALLAEIGIGPPQVAKLTHYVVGLDAEKRAELHRRVGAIWPGERPASTLLGVSRLAREDMLYEVDVQAVIPD